MKLRNFECSSNVECGHIKATRGPHQRRKSSMFEKEPMNTCQVREVKSVRSIKMVRLPSRTAVGVVGLSLGPTESHPRPTW